MEINIIINLVAGLLGGVAVAVVNHLFTRRKTAAETDKLRAEAEKVTAEAEKIRAETLHLSLEIETIQNIQLSREVVFDKDQIGASSKLYWVDDKGIGHPIADENVAALFVSHKGLIGIGQELIARIQIGSALPSITQDSFRRIKGDFFLIFDNKIFYLSSLSLVYKYWDDVSQVPEINLVEFRKYQIYR